jgi:hypothetical protein
MTGRLFDELFESFPYMLATGTRQVIWVDRFDGFCNVVWMHGSHIDEMTVFVDRTVQAKTVRLILMNSIFAYVSNRKPIGLVTSVVAYF